MKSLDSLIDEATEQSCGALLIDAVMIAMGALRNEMRKFRPADLSVPQFRVLAYVSWHAGASLSDAAEHIGLTLPSMSKAVDGLVKREFVKRETSPDDRRRITLALTEKGVEALASAEKVSLEYVNQLLAELPEDDLATIVNAMKIVRRVFAPCHQHCKCTR